MIRNAEIIKKNTLRCVFFKSHIYIDTKLNTSSIVLFTNMFVSVTMYIGK